jgi:hypothetical protein
MKVAFFEGMAEERLIDLGSCFGKHQGKAL